MGIYNSLKSTLSAVLPKGTLFKYEYGLRGAYAQFYKGSAFKCTICKTQLSKFVEAHNDAICPRCGSLQRTRRLWQLLENQFLKDNPKILDFSPSRSIYRKLKPSAFDYTSSDLSGDFLADESFDITQIAVADNSFDLILCYHILEHIPNDKQAMAELYRVLKPNGVCLIQTPFKSGNIYEDESIISPEERERHFGQDDHVRIYSVEGLQKRLENAGLKVEVRVFNEEANNYNGFHQHEYVLICRKV